MNSRNIKVLGYGKLTVATNSYALEELVMNGRMGKNFGITACPAVIHDLLEDVRVVLSGHSSCMGA